MRSQNGFVRYLGSFLTDSLFPDLSRQRVHLRSGWIREIDALPPRTIRTSRRWIWPYLRQRGQKPSKAYHSGSLSSVS